MRQPPKVLLLFAAAFVFSVFAGPAVAQADVPSWYVNGEKLEEPIAIHVEGSLAFHMPISENFSFNMGPCDASFEGTIENDDETGEARGSIEERSMSSPCPTNLSGCELEELQAWSASAWPMAFSGNEVDFENVAFREEFEGCEALGISELEWGGTLKGQWNPETRCIDYSKAGELVVEGDEFPIYVYGTLCLSGEEGAKIALSSNFVPPTATTGGASTKGTSASLAGSVNPEGLPTTYSFEYGTTTAYGSTAPAKPESAGAGTESVLVGAGITGLAYNTTYHYRLVATNEAGTTYGADKTVKTEDKRFWYLNGEKLKEGEENGIAVEGSGELSISLPYSETFTFVSGACGVEGNGTVFNGAETASGVIGSIVFSEGCPTNWPGCEVEAITVNSESWPLTASDATKVSIGDMALTVHYSGCEPIGIPVEMEMDGGVVGIFDNETGCLKIEKASGMEVVPDEIPVKLDGELCLKAKGGTLTLK